MSLSTVERLLRQQPAGRDHFIQYVSDLTPRFCRVEISSPESRILDMVSPQPGERELRGLFPNFDQARSRTLIREAEYLKGLNQRGLAEVSVSIYGTGADVLPKTTSREATQLAERITFAATLRGGILDQRSNNTEPTGSCLWFIFDRG